MCSCPMSLLKSSPPQKKPILWCHSGVTSHRDSSTEWQLTTHSLRQRTKLSAFVRPFPCADHPAVQRKRLPSHGVFGRIPFHQDVWWSQAGNSWGLGRLLKSQLYNISLLPLSKSWAADFLSPSRPELEKYALPRLWQSSLFTHNQHSSTGSQIWNYTAHTPWGTPACHLCNCSYTPYPCVFVFLFEQPHFFIIFIFPSQFINYISQLKLPPSLFPPSPSPSPLKGGVLHYCHLPIAF